MITGFSPQMNSLPAIVPANIVVKLRCRPGEKPFLTHKMQTNSRFNDCIKHSCAPLFILLAQTWQSTPRHNVLNALLHLTEVRMVKSLLWWMQRCTAVSLPFFSFILLHLHPPGSHCCVCECVWVCVCAHVVFKCNNSYIQRNIFKHNS